MSFPADRERWFQFRTERLRACMEAWLEAHNLEAVARPVWTPPRPRGAARGRDARRGGRGRGHLRRARLGVEGSAAGCASSADARALARDRDGHRVPGVSARARPPRPRPPTCGRRWAPRRPTGAKGRGRSRLLVVTRWPGWRPRGSRSSGRRGGVRPAVARGGSVDAVIASLEPEGDARRAMSCAPSTPCCCAPSSCARRARRAHRRGRRRRRVAGAGVAAGRGARRARGRARGLSPRLDPEAVSALGSAPRELVRRALGGDAGRPSSRCSVRRHGPRAGRVRHAAAPSPRGPARTSQARHRELIEPGVDLRQALEAGAFRRAVREGASPPRPARCVRASCSGGRSLRLAAVPALGSGAGCGCGSLSRRRRRERDAAPGDLDDLRRLAEIERACFGRDDAEDALAAELTRAWARIVVAEPGRRVAAFVNSGAWPTRSRCSSSPRRPRGTAPGRSRARCWRTRWTRSAAEGARARAAGGAALQRGRARSTEPGLRGRGRAPAVLRRRRGRAADAGALEGSLLSSDARQSGELNADGPTWSTVMRATRERAVIAVGGARPGGGDVPDAGGSRSSPPTTPPRVPGAGRGRRRRDGDGARDRRRRCRRRPRPVAQLQRARRLARRPDARGPEAHSHPQRAQVGGRGWEAFRRKSRFKELPEGRRRELRAGGAGLRPHRPRAGLPDLADDVRRELGADDALARILRATCLEYRDVCACSRCAARRSSTRTPGGSTARPRTPSPTAARPCATSPTRSTTCSRTSTKPPSAARAARDLDGARWWSSSSERFAKYFGESAVNVMPSTTASSPTPPRAATT
jgi:hypothetical protein